MSAREQLRDAMADLLWERGYAATSPRDVLARAGVGQGSMYHHYAGKHDLALDAFSSVAQEMAGQTSELDGDGSPLERIIRYLTVPRPGTRGCRVGRMTQDPQVVADPELLTVVAEAFATVLRRWEAVIAEAVEVGELPADVDPADLARTLAAVLQGGYVLARAQGDQEPMDAAVRGAVSLLEAARAAAR
ncbi:TetR/AcrR family transcriptional regulator [Conexibacter sp. SYSU D00693]|uniref:TetR/AcrR family transcriptional regulator n=1 Tax=Conexibacter sp. SYSU D00693 TaxID=2812560 RepID=UPI00196A5C85|nr:TetR/AcrR family transcriptional regulator [Conexibacter sp. SYSU D00693]